MRPRLFTVTGIGTTNWIPIDYKQDPINIAVGCIIVSGSATYNVEHTYDDIYNSAITPTAYQNSGITGATTNKDGNYSIPIRALRLNVTGGTSPVVSMNVIQSTR